MFTDDLDDETLWQTGDGPDGRVAFDRGTLILAVTRSGATVRSGRALDGPRVVLRVAGPVTLSAGLGGAGLGCGRSEQDDLVGVVVGTDGRWKVVGIAAGVSTVLADGALLGGPDPAIGGTLDLAVECAVTPDGSIRVVAWRGGHLVADVATRGSAGPWDLPTVVAEATEAPFFASVDRVEVAAGATYAPRSAGPAVAKLLAQLPSAFRDDCSPSSTTDGPRVVANVTCRPAEAIEEAQYIRYDGVAAVAAAFRALVDSSATPLVGTDCSQGPSELSWSIGGESEGRMACFPDPSSDDVLWLVWTDEVQAVVAVGRSSSADYAALYDWWLGAGVLP